MDGSVYMVSGDGFKKNKQNTIPFHKNTSGARS